MPKLSSISAAVRTRIVLTLLLDRESRQKNGHESILSKGNTKLGMTGDLKNEAAIAAFIQQAVVR